MILEYLLVWQGIGTCCTEATKTSLHSPVERSTSHCAVLVKVSQRQGACTLRPPRRHLFFFQLLGAVWEFSFLGLCNGWRWVAVQMQPRGSPCPFVASAIVHHIPFGKVLSGIQRLQVLQRGLVAEAVLL